MQEGKTLTDAVLGRGRSATALGGLRAADRIRRREVHVIHERRPLALITGASSGIGRSYAERLAADGHDLIVVARRGDRLTQLQELLEARHSVSVEPLVADLSTDAGMNAVDAVVENQRPETVIDNAALAHYMPLVDLPQEELTELVMLSVLAPARLIHSAVPHMIERGRGTIVSVATLLVFSGSVTNPQLPKRVAYAATKAFLFTFVRLLAAELEGTGVQLQVVCPGIVATEFHTRQGLDMSSRPRLDPADIVEASLRGLQQGELVCIPSLENTDALERRDQAEAAVLTDGMRAQLADRYRK
jgi:short-subunit dehydrogenase